MIMLALHNYRNIGEKGVPTGMIEVKVRIDYMSDVPRRHTDLSQLVLDIILWAHDRENYLVQVVSSPRMPRVINVHSVHSGIDEDNPPVVITEDITEDRNMDPFTFPEAGCQGSATIYTVFTEVENVKSHEVSNLPEKSEAQLVPGKSPPMDAEVNHDHPLTSFLANERRYFLGAM
jgi:hypothetical protein